MSYRLVDDNGAIDFVDDNGVQCFVDDFGNYTCVQDAPSPDGVVGAAFCEW